MLSNRMSRTTLVALIALVVHEANAAYSQSMGEETHPWSGSTDQHRASIMAGVQMHMDNPESTPEQAHESWLAAKIEAGWVYGETKDIEKKIHPCMKPYAELPPEQKAKDYIFRGVVHALSTALDGLYPDIAKELINSEQFKAEVQAQIEAGIAAVPSAKVAVGQAATSIKSEAKPGSIAVEYIGRKSPFIDTIYGSGLTFANGQVRSVPATLAREFLRHADSFTEAAESALPVKRQDAVPDGNELDDNDDQQDTDTQLAEAKLQEQKKVDEENRIADIRDQVSMMDNEALSTFAETHFQQKINKSYKVETNRAKVIGFIDQFGVA